MAWLGRNERQLKFKTNRMLARETHTYNRWTAMTYSRWLDDVIRQRDTLNLIYFWKRWMRAAGTTPTQYGHPICHDWRASFRDVISLSSRPLFHRLSPNSQEPTHATRSVVCPSGMDSIAVTRCECDRITVHVLSVSIHRIISIIRTRIHFRQLLSFKRLEKRTSRVAYYLSEKSRVQPDRRLWREDVSRVIASP